MRLTSYKTSMAPVWCPGCGNYSIFNCMMAALSDLGIDGSKVVNVTGIGCSGKMVNHLTTYGFHCLHGRTLPVATGVALTNHDLTVIVNSGDGDSYGIGVGHFIHAARRNVNILHLVHDNHIYGLTSGQASPTTDIGKFGKSTPDGVIDEPLNPIALALTAGCTFVARGYIGESEHLKELIKAGIQYNGFAYIDILQTCPTFAKDYNFKYYKERVYKLDDDYDATDFNQALQIAYADKTALGIIYEVEKQPHSAILPQLSEGTLVSKPIKKKDVSGMFKKYR